MQLQNIIRFSLNLEFLFKFSENLAQFQIWRLRNDDFRTSSKAEINLRLQNIFYCHFLFKKQATAVVLKANSIQILLTRFNGQQHCTADNVSVQFLYLVYRLTCLVMCECILLFDLVLKKNEKSHAITGLIKSFWKRQSDVQSINGCQLKPNYWWVCC